MKLLNLYMQNFKTHKETYIDFTTLSSPVLIKGVNKDSNGSNGAGKSSIFDAIEYALYGKSQKFLRIGEKHGLVKLSFEQNNSIYTITKTLDIDNYEVTLEKDNEFFSGSKTEIEKYIRETLRISKNLFDQTIFQSQGFSQVFGLMTPKLKSEFIMELLELDKWESYYNTSVSILKSISDLSNKIKLKKTMLEEQINQILKEVESKNETQLKQELERKKFALEKKQEIYNNLVGTKTILDKKEFLLDQIKKYTNQIKTIKNKLQELNKKQENLLQLKQKIESRKITPIDENYRKNILGSSLSLEKDLSVLEYEKKSKEKELEEFLKVNTSILEVQVCPFCKQKIPEDYKQTFAAYIQSEKISKENYITEINNKIGNLLKRRKEYAEQLQNLEEQYKIYQENIKNFEDVNNKLQLIYQEKEQLEERLKESEALLFQFNTEYEQIKDVNTENILQHINALETDIKVLNDEILAINTELNTIQENKKKIDALKSNMFELEKEIQSYAKAENIITHIRNIFSRTGIQKWLFLHSLEEIKHLANSLLAPVDIAINFIFEKQKKSEGFKPVFDLDIIKLKEGKKYSLNVLSGGEKTLVNFAIRLAFSSILALKYNFNFLIIDEGFADLDAKNREILADMLYQLSNQFQIFLVTHITDLENMFSNVIIVERENNISRVII